MRTYSLGMGCAQASTSVIPTNHIPIERVYANEGYPMREMPPVVMITASPTPVYVKSALKKPNLDGRGRTDTLSFLQPRPSPLNKSVNFDEQVQVKSRTPTPSKIWYEKESSVMPMRRYPRDDNAIDDYDDEIPSVSSDEEQENKGQTDLEPLIPTLGPPSLLPHRKHPNNFWYKSNSIDVFPQTNTMIRNQSSLQSSYNTNTYATENSMTSSTNRIKVRRKLPYPGLPQTPITPLYQPPVQPSIIPSYQSSTIPVYQPSAQTLTTPSYQTSVQPPTVPAYQTPIQPSSQNFQINRALPNTNAALIEHPTALSNVEPSPQSAYYAFNRHPPPVENSS